MSFPRSPAEERRSQKISGQHASEVWEDPWVNQRFAGELHWIWPDGFVRGLGFGGAEISNGGKDVTRIPLEKHFVTPLSCFKLRHTKQLETHLQKLDAEYDKCNEVMAKGEVNGFGGTLPGCNMLKVLFMLQPV